MSIYGTCFRHRVRTANIALSHYFYITKICLVLLVKLARLSEASKGRFDQKLSLAQLYEH